MSPFNRALATCTTDAARAVLRAAYWSARYPDRRQKTWLAYSALSAAEKASVEAAVDVLHRAGLRARLPLSDPSVNG